jgi:hypothetical protein
MHVGSEVLRVITMKGTIFWDIMPLIWQKITCFGITCCSIFRAEEAICSSETLANFHQIIWNYIPEDSTLHASHSLVNSSGDKL